jgi:hypothetical protein
VRRWAIIATVAAAVLAAALVLVLWPRSHPARVAAPAPLAAPPVLAFDTSTPTPTPSTSKPKPTPPHEPVAPAGPTHFLLSGPAFAVSANVCAMPPVFPLDPPGDQVHTVCWVDSGFGVAPGTTAHGTTYVLGHAWSVQKLVLNPLAEYATAHEAPVTALPNGVPTYSVPSLVGKYTIALTTPGGVLTYTVTSAFLVGKDEARNVATLMDTTVPNRVVLITCAVKNGVDLPQNVIVYATLTSSTSHH